METQLRTKPGQKSRRTGIRTSQRRPPGSVLKPTIVKQILATTDFSAGSKNALTYAAAMAKRLGSKVALLNVVEPPPRLAGLESVVIMQFGDAAVGRAYQLLDAVKEQIFESSLRVRTHVRTGKPHLQIAKASAELDAGLLIMATHGYSGWKHTLLGSTTERVLRHAPCSVLVVRAKREQAKSNLDFPRILFATDLSDACPEALSLVQMLAAHFGSTVSLMHVIERFPISSMMPKSTTRSTAAALSKRADALLTDLSRALQHRQISVNSLVKFGTPYVEITKAAKTLDASLVVVGTHGNTGLKRIYLGSVAERVVRHAPCPVLVARERRP
ncbi:MAG: putative Universal stress protein [Verrucomicrobiales bacterium]|nr:putative Universal stress protein [Verrucomicrobiales bacterium]